MLTLADDGRASRMIANRLMLLMISMTLPEPMTFQVRVEAIAQFEFDKGVLVSARRLSTNVSISRENVANVVCADKGLSHAVASTLS